MTEAAEPFQVRIAESELADLRRRLEAARWPEDFANGQWEYGTNRAYLEELVTYWRDRYDWRAAEAAINALPQFRVSLDGVPLHFVHRKGIGIPGGRRPLPLILSHGWPWTFWDFAKVIGPLSDPAAHGGDPADAFEVIVPSLPGFAFSSPLTKPGLDAMATADLFHRLMTEVLGHPRYGAHGGDWGAFITAQLGHKYPGQVIGIHLLGGAPLDFFTQPLPAASDYADDEAGWHAKTTRFFATESGYSALQSTKPQTLAYAMSDSPIGLAAWLLEKRRDWSDCGGDAERRFSKDELLTQIMLVWLTRTLGSSARFYAEGRLHPWQPSHDRQPIVEVPTGILKLEADVVHWPRKIMERAYLVQRWTRTDEGGHFAPAEVPATVVHELREFFRPLRAAI